MAVMKLERNIRPAGATRQNPTTNPFGLRGIEHAALNVRDVDRAVTFYAAALGAEVYATSGFSEEDRRKGRVRHVFTFVGRTIVQLGFPHDGRTFPDLQNTSGWPHWAFDCTPAQLDANLERLRGMGIPVNGPMDHGPGTSIYFQDLDGNKLELTTWEPYPGPRTVRTGGRANTNWPSLAHRWRPGPGQEIRLGPRRGDPELRHARTVNRHGLRGLDHVALNVRDPEVTAVFIERVLGGQIATTGGYDPGEAATGRVRHIFTHVGDTLFQVGFPHDHRTFPDGRNASGWPHWAFEVSIEALDAACERLRREGIPFNGPVRHPASIATSVYFQDPDGNKLELVTLEPYPVERAQTEVGAKANDWPTLAHNWRPCAPRVRRGVFGATRRG